jgi:iron(III) transport system permease protein
MIGRWFPRLALGAALSLGLALVLVWPAVATVIDAARGAENPGGGSRTPVEGGPDVRPWRMAAETLGLVSLTEAMAMPVGVALAFLLFRTDLPGRRLWLALLALEACVPLPLHATAWLGGFGNLGRSQVFGSAPLLVGRFGAAFVHATAALPWIVWIVGLGLLAVEPELEESARLEMPSWRVAWSVSLRRARGAIAAAALAVAVLTAGDMTVTDLVAVRTYAEEAYIQFGLGKGPGTAAATTLPPLVVVGGLVLFGASRLLRSDPARIVSTAIDAPRWRLGPSRLFWGIATALVMVALLGLPLYSLVWRAGRVGGVAAHDLAPRWSWYGLLGTLRAAGSDILGPSLRRAWRGPLVGSLLWGSVGASLAVALAWPLAWACRRPGPWRWVTIAAVALALATPGPVAGMALVLAYYRSWSIYNSPAIVVLAYVMRTWPYALILLWPVVRKIPGEYLEAAELDGYGPAGRVWRVALPMTLGPLGLAWAAAFVLALGELPAAALVMPPGYSSLTLRIWDKLHIGVESSLAGFVLVSLGVFALAGSFVSFGVGRLGRQRLGFENSRRGSSTGVE